MFGMLVEVDGGGSLRIVFMSRLLHSKPAEASLKAIVSLNRGSIKNLQILIHLD